jgi:membrane protease YdiL (CAAX protease family)
MSEKSATSSSPAAVRVLLSVILPLAGALTFSFLAGGRSGEASSDQGSQAVLLAGAGLVSWFVGLRWYRLPGLGLRGHRPLYAGIGFAVLGWSAFLLARFATVEVVDFGSAGSSRTFVYLLLFEAFCTQLWSFGIFFRAVAGWRGPLAAAIASGILFGIVGFLFFEEAFSPPNASAQLTLWSAIYFISWGVFYGVIRLRTGGLLGTVLVQAMHSWTAWQLMMPQNPPAASELRNLYLVSSIFYLIFIWRLWPRREEDYRV